MEAFQFNQSGSASASVVSDDHVRHAHESEKQRYMSLECNVDCINTSLTEYKIIITPFNT